MTPEDRQKQPEGGATPPGGGPDPAGSGRWADLVRKLEDRAERLLRFNQALIQLNGAIVRSETREQLFSEACRIAVQVGRLPLAWVGLLEPGGEEVVPVTVFGPASDFIQGRRIRVGPDGAEGRGPLARALRTGSLAVDLDFQKTAPTAEWREAVRRYDLAAVSVLPLRDGERVIGGICLYATHEEAFRPEAMDLIERLGEDISYALEHMARESRWAQAEGRLRVSEHLFSATLDTLSASMCLLDGRGRVLATNAAWRTFADRGNPFIYGIGPGDSYMARLLHMAGPLKGRPEMAEVIEMAGLTIEVILGARESAVGEYRVAAEDGYRWYAATLTQFSYEGLQRVLLAHREITDKKESEERLKRSESLFRIIAENAQDLIGLADFDGKGLYFSPSHKLLLGYEPEEMERMEPMAFVHLEDRIRLRQRMRALAEGREESFRQEARLQCKDGSWKTVEAHMALIRESGGPNRILVVARDETARLEAERVRQRMEVELRHAQKLESIGQLAAGIAHEINTPTQYIGDNLRFILDSLEEVLGSIDGLRSALEGAPGLAEEPLSAAHELLAKVDLDYLREELPKAARQSLEGVDRVSKIVGAMKEFSHPGGEEKTPTDLNRAIGSTTTISRNEWKYVAELVTDFDPTLPPVPCHPGEINQVVLNLVVNAAHAIADVVGSSGAKGRITVRTRHEDGWALIQVEDTGSGIPEAIRSRVFDPFFTTKDVGKGSGQGLAIAHSVVVDKHGGTIGFDTGQGQGTVFTVRLPLAAKASG